MAFKADHELHKRRLSRNVGLGLVLVCFVALVYGLTVAKVGALYQPEPSAPEASQ